MPGAARSLAAQSAAGAAGVGNDVSPVPAGLGAVVGDRLIYTIVVSNGGPADATNVRLDDQLSVTTPLLAATATQGSCTAVSSTAVSCTLGTIPAGSSATVTVTARAVRGGIATNTATVVADQPPTNPAALQATTTVTVTPAPQYGRSFNLLPISGKVTFRLPKHKGFVPLLTITNVPARTEINALAGTAGIVSARNPANKPQTGKFAGARFVVSYQPPTSATQAKRTRLLVTQLRLSAPLSCPRRKLADNSQGRDTRSLWGNAKGDFRTTGRYASATVRGTEWRTKDTCTSTTVYVRRGRVDVFDFLRRKHSIITTRHSYTATHHP